MSTVHEPSAESPPLPGSPEDPFRLGWRYVKRIGADGTEEYEQVPLTEEDLLFPEEGDFAVQTDMHVVDCTFLRTIFDTRFADDSSDVALVDCRVDFNVPGLKPLGPDVIVLLGNRSRRKDWGTYHVGNDGGKPAFVIEVTSEDTRKNDLGIKLDYYHRAGVPLYIVIDVRHVNDYRRLKLIGFRWTEAGYERIAPNERGWFWLEPVGLWLGTADIEAGYGERAACYDPATGEEVPGYRKLLRDFEQAETRAEQAETRAEQAETRAEQAETRAEQAETRAEQEAGARSELEARLRALEEELQRLRNTGPGSGPA